MRETLDKLSKAVAPFLGWNQEKMVHFRVLENSVLKRFIGATSETEEV
jgi:hypothetical protein